MRTTVLLEVYPNAGYTEVEATLAQILKTISLAQTRGGLRGRVFSPHASHLFTKHTYSLRRLPGAFAWCWVS